MLNEAILHSVSGSHALSTMLLVMYAFVLDALKTGLCAASNLQRPLVDT